MAYPHKVRVWDFQNGIPIHSTQNETLGRFEMGFHGRRFLNGMLSFSIVTLN